MLNIKEEAAKLICANNSELELADIQGMLDTPPNADMGDVALPCFKLSKVMRKAPNMIAEGLAESIADKGIFTKIEAVSGYLNFFVDRTYYVDSVVKSISEKGDNYGSENIGEGKTIVLDYSAPNIAKPFHVGHLFTTVIGSSLYRTYKFMGYNAVGVNHLGDWGTQFGKLIVAYKKWGADEDIETGKVKTLVKLYVKFHDEAKLDDSLNDEAREWFAKLENGDQEAHDLWKRFIDISLKEFKKVYDMLGIEFDSYAGESFYNDKMQPIIEELKEKNMLHESEGAQIVDLDEYDMPPCLLLKSDGSTLYATRDIAAAFYRKKTYDFEKCLYVMGGSQALHFKQWTKVVELMGYEWVKDCAHVPFGMVSIEGEKLATRSGNVVLLEDLFATATEKTLAIIEENNPGLENKEEVAKQIGIGAVVFGYLQNGRIKDISFSWDNALNFDGETGPYVQYTHARTCSLLSKAGADEGAFDWSKFDASKLETKAEFLLTKTLADFSRRIKLALRDYEPSVITRYLVDVAQAFNSFYHDCPVLVDDEALKASRLALVKATGVVLKNGLYLIGLSAPERV